MAIADTGIGLTAEQCARLFGAFVQADASTTRKHGGTGLGLQISKRLAETLGGSITVASELGKGSTFAVTVATGELGGVATLPPHEVAALPPQPVAATHRDIDANALRGLRILLAEDGLDNQRLIAFHLARAGAEVTVAANGRRALEHLTLPGNADGPLLSPPPIDLLLTDMQMPEMDGYELAQTLRARGSTLPIVALTANAMTGDRERCQAVGCDGYATKPIDKVLLIKVCRETVDGKRTTRRAA
ncbi:MAG: response regulator [Phycisphaerales bacterium]